MKVERLPSYKLLTLLNKDEKVSELDLCDEMSEDLKSEVRLAEGEFELNPNEISLIKEKFPKCTRN